VPVGQVTSGLLCVGVVVMVPAVVVPADLNRRRGVIDMRQRRAGLHNGGLCGQGGGKTGTCEHSQDKTRHLEYLFI